jgi:hypothetical protein
MPRSAASIQAEIAVLETQLPKLAAAAKYSVDGQSKDNQDYKACTERLDQLYQQLDRATGSAPLFTRGRVTGLGGTQGSNLGSQS